MTDQHAKGQVSSSAADIYEQFFVPALFAEWPNRLLDSAEIDAGHDVLDVACGTGIVARAAAERVEPSGSVVGLDVNAGMLAVARQKAPDIRWETGSAEALPFADAQFDRTLSQFGLMFFEDRVQALREMARVTRPGGKLGVAVWASLADTPGYAAVAAMLEALFGAEIAQSLHMPYALGDPDEVMALFNSAEIPNVTLQTVVGTARFPSLDDWMFTEIRGWTLADQIDNDDFVRLQQEAPTRLAAFVTAEGDVQFDAPAHLFVASV